MGKKKTGSPSSPAASPTKDVVEANEQQVTVVGLRDEGNSLFGRKEYGKALETYEKALRLIGPEGHSDKALLHNNKAACHMMLKRFKEAVQECTLALDTQPGYQKALVRRAKALESQGMVKRALADIQKANSSGQGTADTQETERRLKDVVAGKRSPGANGALKKAGPASKRQLQQWVFQAKVTLDDEVRLLQLTPSVTYAELLEHVAIKFPGAGPLVLKYLDREGDLVTITERADVQKAMGEAYAAAEAAAGGRHGPKLLAQPLPPLRLVAVRAKSAADVPAPPPAEDEALQRALATRRMLLAQAAQAQKAAQAKAAAEEPAQQEVYELDQWLVDFANLFREMLGVDPDRHLDLQQVGWEKCSEAMDAAVASEKSVPLFAAAADKFQEVTASGLFQWGNTYVCLANKYSTEAASKGVPISEVEEKVEAELQKAEKRYHESLAYKADFYDAAIGMGQLHFERAKLYSRLVVAPLKVEKGEDGKEPSPEAQQAAQNANMAKALAKLRAEDVERAEPHLAKAVAQYEAAIGMLPPEERSKPIRPQGEKKEDGTEEDIGFYAQTLVLWGNMLYEHSQMRAAVGGEWAALLAEAVEKFKAAGCAAADIRQALASHSRSLEIDVESYGLPQPEAKAEGKPDDAKTDGKPDEAKTEGKPAAEASATSTSADARKPEEKAAGTGEPEVANGGADAAKDAPAAAKDAVRGLPSLGPKPKKKAEEKA